MVIRLIMEAISPPGKRLDKEQEMVGGEGTERTNAIDRGKGTTDK